MTKGNANSDTILAREVDAVGLTIYNPVTDRWERVRSDGTGVLKTTGASTGAPAHTRIQDGTGTTLATVRTPAATGAAAPALLTEADLYGYDDAAALWRRLLASAPADAKANPASALDENSHLHGYNGITWDRLKTLTDTTTARMGLLRTFPFHDQNGGVLNMNLYQFDAQGNVPTFGAASFNGTTFDRQRGNIEGTALASAARTGNALSPILTNHNARGILVWIFISAASGTGGLQVLIRGRNPDGSTADTSLNAPPIAITATGVYGYEVYPGSSTAGTAGTANINQRTSAVLPRTFYIQVVHGDGTSYTYSVGYSLIV